ncbi:MAG: DMT family transporter [Hyphomicrobiales bacterium]|nr:MAG: DMT family transporter [Hyphomicrobiales bacterium]
MPSSGLDMSRRRKEAASGKGASADMLDEERAHRGADLGGVGLQREVAAVDEANVSLRHVALEGFGARGNEERIVLAPDRLHRRLMLAQVGLDGVVERDVGLVIEQQVELDFVVAGTRQIEIVEVAAVGRDLARIVDAVSVLEERRLGRQQAAQRVAIFTFNRAVSLLGSSAATAIIALIPAIASLLAIPILGEQPSPAEGMAIAVIVAGVLLAARRPGPTEPPDHRREVR